MSASESRNLRSAILTAAEQLFIEKGYHGLSMRQIAEAVGVSKAALYYHFRDKEQLFLAMMDLYLDEIGAVIDRARGQPGPVRERIRTLVEGILAQPVQKRAVIRLASQEMGQLSDAARRAFWQAYHQKFFDRIRAILQEGMESRELRTLDPVVAAWTLLGVMFPYFYPSHSGEVPSPADVLDQILAIYLDGIAQ